MWSAVTAASPKASRSRASSRAAWAGHVRVAGDEVERSDRRERMPWRTFCSNGTSRSCQSRRPAASSSSSVVASLSSHTSAAARRCVVVGLGGDPAAGVGLGHPTLVDEPPHPRLLVRAHDDDQVVAGAHALLDEQRHVVHDHGVRAGVVDDLRGAPARSRGWVMRLEVAQRRRVSEDDAAERRPVERTVVVEHGVAEPVDDGREAGAAGLDDLAGQASASTTTAPSAESWCATRRLAGPDASR